MIAVINDATSRIWRRFTEHDTTEENLRTFGGWVRRYGRPLATPIKIASFGRPALRRFPNNCGETRCERSYRTRGVKMLETEDGSPYVCGFKLLSKNCLARIKSFQAGEAPGHPRRRQSHHGRGARATFAYSLAEVKAIRNAVPEPARSVVLCAALSGLRKDGIAGLRWEGYTGKELTVQRSVWNGITNEPKTTASGAAVPVMRLLADALDAHRERMGKLAVGPIFQAGTGKPLNLDNLAKRVIQPAIEKCGICRLSKEEQKPEGRLFEQDKNLPKWRGWHAFRRGLATNLHVLGGQTKKFRRFSVTAISRSPSPATSRR